MEHTGKEGMLLLYFRRLEKAADCLDNSFSFFDFGNEALIELFKGNILFSSSSTLTLSSRRHDNFVNQGVLELVAVDPIDEEARVMLFVKEGYVHALRFNNEIL